jgi:hypothetical protein
MLVVSQFFNYICWKELEMLFLRRTLLIIFLFIWGNGIAQVISISVVSPYGNFFAGSTGSISATLGEPISTTLFSAANILTEGFEQSDDFVTTSVAPAYTGIEYSVFPNPSTAILNITGKCDQPVKVNIVDVSGKVVLLTESKELNGSIEINIEDLEKGIYFLSLTNASDGKVLCIQKIVKV